MLRGDAVHGALAHAVGHSGAAQWANLPWSVPVDPDADQARELLRDELTNPVYHQSPSPLERLLTWLQELLDGLMVPQIGGLWAGIAILAALLVIVGLSLVIAGPLRRGARRRDQPPVFTDDTRSSDDLRLAAHQAALAADFVLATLEAFRALVRRCEERAVLEPAPGQTAHEAANALALVFPAHSSALQDAALVFDATYYGDSAADRQSYEQVSKLDVALGAATPTLLPSVS